MSSPVRRVEGPARLPDAVLWDLDGTLIDSEPYWIEAEHEIVALHGGQWSEELAHALVGSDLLVSAQFIRDHSPVSWEPERIVDELLTRVVAQMRIHLPWRPGAAELLHELRAAGVPTALVTMSWTRLTDALLASDEVAGRDLFDLVVTGDSVARGKPHPEPYLTAAAGLGVEPGRCVAIEDSPTGVASAVSAGVPTVAVPLVLDVPPTPGAVRLPSLVGVTPSGLVELAARAAAGECLRTPDTAR